MADIANLNQRVAELEEQQRQTVAAWETQRMALLNSVDAIERLLGITPRTSELRKESKGR